MNTALLLFLITGSVELIYTIKKIKPNCAILSSLSGIISLIAVNYIGTYIGLHIPINLFSLAVSALGGIPAVTLLVTLMTFIR